MAVYVDDMKAKFGRMIMCHMIADTDEELHAMAAKIGVQRKWFQGPPAHDSHYDIAISKRALAVKMGAVEITYRQCGVMNRYRKQHGQLCSAQAALDYLTARAAGLSHFYIEATSPIIG
jgi:hypothetical protein